MRYWIFLIFCLVATWMFIETAPAGDFNADGVSDLLIGVPYQNLGSGEGEKSRAGAMHAVYGVKGTGLMNTGSTFWTQDTDGTVDQAESFEYFSSSMAIGDFDGNGADDVAVSGRETRGGFPLRGIGMVTDNPASGCMTRLPARFFLKNTFSNGSADETFRFGPRNSGWVPIAGDWNGNGIGGIGLYNPATGWFYLRNHFSAGNAETEFRFGPSKAGWIPLAMGPWE
jgi:hypothetical protein